VGNVLANVHLLLEFYALLFIRVSPLCVSSPSSFTAVVVGMLHIFVPAEVMWSVLYLYHLPQRVWLVILAAS